MNFSEFINIIYKYLKLGIEKPNFLRNLFDSVIRKPETEEEIETDKNDSYNPIAKLDGSTLTKIFNGKTTISSESATIVYRHLYKDNFSYNIESLDDNLKERLIYELSKYGFNSYLENVHDICFDIFAGLIESCIGGKNNVTSEDIMRKNEVRALDYPLLYDSENTCPLCNNNLVEMHKTKQFSNYKLVNIYPYDLDDELRKKFIKIKPRPNNLDLIENKIALCQKCAKIYESEPTIEVYSKLLDLKKTYINKEKFRNILFDTSLDDDIKKIIHSLNSFTGNFCISKSKLIAKKIKNKIEQNNFILKSDIESKITVFYKFIEEEFRVMQWNYGNSFETVSNQFNIAYLKLKNLGFNQNEIFTKLSEWICKKLKLDYEKYKTASEILVAFFVQNCEVFDEIAK